MLQNLFLELKPNKQTHKLISAHSGTSVNLLVKANISSANHITGT